MYREQVQSFPGFCWGVVGRKGARVAVVAAAVVDCLHINPVMTGAAVADFCSVHCRIAACCMGHAAAEALSMRALPPSAG